MPQDDVMSGRRAATAGRIRVPGPRIGGLSLSALGFVVVLVGWQLAVMIGGYPEIILPSPLAVAVDVFARRALLAEHSLITVWTILAGFGLSIVIGVPIALAIAFSPVLGRVLMPLLVVSNSVPKIAIAPLLLIWFGFGFKVNIVLAVLVAVFPIVINTVLGLRGLDPDLVRLGRIMGGDAWRIFVHIRLPAALPSIFAGLKLGITLATIGVIFGEMIAGQQGIGYLSQFAASQLYTVMAFSCIACMSAMGIFLFYLVALVEALITGGRRAA